jgi:hypothetical protein
MLRQTFSRCIEIDITRTIAKSNIVTVPVLPLLLCEDERDKCKCFKYLLNFMPASLVTIVCKCLWDTTILLYLAFVWQKVGKRWILERKPDPNEEPNWTGFGYLPMNCKPSGHLNLLREIIEKRQFVICLEDLTYSFALRFDVQISEILKSIANGQM